MVIHHLRNNVGEGNTLSIHSNREFKNFIQSKEDLINGYSWLMGHIPLSAFTKIVSRTSNWKIFTILRDPYQRLISQYKYLHYSDHPDHVTYKGMDFETFLDFYRKESPNMMCHFMGHPNNPEKALEEVKRHNVSVYYFDKLHELETDLSIITGRDITFDKVINKSKSVSIDFDQYKNNIEEIIAKDMELYLACRGSSLGRLI